MARTYLFAPKYLVSNGKTPEIIRIVNKKKNMATLISNGTITKIP